jgi:hypothetical protein
VSVTEVTFHQGQIRLCQPPISPGSHMTLMEIKAAKLHQRAKITFWRSCNAKQVDETQATVHLVASYQK